MSVTPILPHRTRVMGIVNVTPDSFSDGGRYLEPSAAIDHGLRLVDEGADILDVGGESTRPGATAVTAEEELARILLVVETLAAKTDTPVSVDTMKASVARAALDAGARMLNDVSAGRADPAMFEVAASAGVPICLMHMLGEPRTMQDDPQYGDVVAEVRAFLLERGAAAEAAGIAREHIFIDPGFGFGKTAAQNLAVLARLSEFADGPYDVLVGTSRKTFIGATLDLPVAERLEGTAATVALAIVGGARIVRVHDVAAMRRVADMTDAVIAATGAVG